MKMMMKTSLLMLLCSISVTTAEQYTFDFRDTDQLIVSSGTDQLQTRSLQTQSPDPCYYDGANLICNYAFVTGNAKNETNIAFEARCDINALYGFDYRRAANCACQAKVTPPEGPAKLCPCTVCQADLGETPISVDCSGVADQGSATSATAKSAGNSTTSNVTADPYIFNTCTSVDCSGACNGTCSLTCDDSATACPFCENFIGNQPTMAPTGSGEGKITNFGQATSGAASFQMLRSSLTAAAAAAFVFALV
jgi:hypothetical protein